MNKSIFCNSTSNLIIIICFYCLIDPIFDNMYWIVIGIWFFFYRKNFLWRCQELFEANAENHFKIYLLLFISREKIFFFFLLMYKRSLIWIENTGELVYSESSMSNDFTSIKYIFWYNDFTSNYSNLTFALLWRQF